MSSNAGDKGRQRIRERRTRQMDKGWPRERMRGRRKREPKAALPAFAITGSNKKRLVIDARHANSHCQSRSVKCEGFRELAMVLRPNRYFISFDVKDAYHHLTLMQCAALNLPSCCAFRTSSATASHLRKFCKPPGFILWTLRALGRNCAQLRPKCTLMRQEL